ncbi:hypothetical protein Tco_0508509 [Tanacetum coccineum]
MDAWLCGALPMAVDAVCYYEAKCADIGYGFLSFSFSSFEELEKDAVPLLKRIRKFSVAQDIGARAAIHIFNRISFAIAKGEDHTFDWLKMVPTCDWLRMVPTSDWIWISPIFFLFLEGIRGGRIYLSEADPGVLHGSRHDVHIFNKISFVVAKKLEFGLIARSKLDYPSLSWGSSLLLRFSLYLFSFVMSKRNLAFVTCSLTQSDLLGFVEEYGIALCYDPQLSSSEKTALDALEGYIPLYLSLFSIGNLRLLLNTFCLDVFEFFKCHFPLLNPFGVARVTTFIVACKAYEGEPSLPLFRSLCNVGPAGKPLLPYACPALITDFCYGVGTFAFPYPTEPFDEVLRSRLVHHPFEAQTFSKPILYLAGLAGSWNFMKRPGQTPSFSARSVNQPIDVCSPYLDHSKAVDDNDQGESSSVPGNKDIAGLELTVVGDSSSKKGAGAAEGSKKRHSITAALEEGASVIKLVLVAPQSKRLKSESMMVLGGSVREEADILSRLLPPKNGLLEHEMLKLEDSLSKAQKNQDVEVERMSKRCQDLEAERESLLSKESNLREEVATLSSKLKIVNLERTVLVRDFLPLAALDEVHGLGNSWDFKDVKDYNPKAEKIYDEAAEVFYKLEFPYISLLVGKAG